MPIYEYFCSLCNSKFEMLRPVSKSNEDAVCPICRSNAKRIFSSFNSPYTATGVTDNPMNNSNPCSTCSALSCDTCGK